MTTGEVEMEVSEVLKKAWAAVEDAELPAEIQLVAFQEAIRLTSPSNGVSLSGAPARRETGDNSGSNGSGGTYPDVGNREGASESEIYDRVSEQTGVDRDKLEQLVHLDDDELRVSVPGLKLGKSNSERTRAVAQILTITRGFGLDETETSLEVIRGECERLKVYDSANFSAHLKALSGYVINGGGQNRRLRAKSPGIEAFATLVDSLLGGT
jgi:hypothetical protein